jgi:hypothetical protein
MLHPDPFLLSAAEIATTEAMRAQGTIPQDWRYVEISWQHAAIFDKIVEIGGDELRVLSSSAGDFKKRGEIVFGPQAATRLNEQALQIRVLFKTSALAELVEAAEAQEAA